MTISTHWHVITGGPSCGKTRVTQYLAYLGHYTIPEVARLYIDVERSKGCTTDAIRADESQFQAEVVRMKMDLEGRILPQTTVFFDRGLPDSIAYLALYHQDPEPTIAACQKRRYQSVFLLDQLPFERDYARTEDDAAAHQLSTLIDNAYTNLGYTVIQVPVMPIDERAQYILNHIPK